MTYSVLKVLLNPNQPTNQPALHSMCNFVHELIVHKVSLQISSVLQTDLMHNSFTMLCSLVYIYGHTEQNTCQQQTNRQKKC